MYSFVGASCRAGFATPPQTFDAAILFKKLLKQVFPHAGRGLQPRPKHLMLRLSLKNY